MAKYLVFDLETGTKTVYKRKASAFCAENYVVARGWKKQGDTHCSYEYFHSHNRKSHLFIGEDVTMLVGFNLKFDLLWEMAQENPYLAAFFKRGGRIWDCQYAEYLLEAQHDNAQMCSMDSIVEKYGGRKKIDQVKILWEAGVNTPDIPEDLLIDYLVGTEDEKRNSGDIGNNELIFLGQIKAAIAQGQDKMIFDRMDGLLATTDMEFNGLKVDVKEAGARLKILSSDLVKYTAELDTFIPRDLEFDFNWGSRTHVSCLIFGGTIKYELQRPYIDEATGELARKKATESWPLSQGVPYHPDDFARRCLLPDVFVSGKRKGEQKFKRVDVQGDIKVKYQDFFVHLPGYTDPKPDWETKSTDGKGNPLYSTSSDVIEEITLRDIPFLKALGKKQSLDKEIGTYYVRIDPKKGPVGMLTCVQTHDHILHHKLNHVNTVTTRLSSNDPNLQNLPRGDKSEVKKMFVSRFTQTYCELHGIPFFVYEYGPVQQGVMIEADYSQLEVVVQGVLSGDEALCNDLRAKIDFHCKRVSAKFGCTYEEALYWCKDETYEEFKLWKGRRTGVKEFSFQRAYGAGAAAIAHATGMPVDDVKALIENEEIMYPGIIRFNANVEAAVVKSARPFQAANDDGVWQTYRRGYYQTPTGTRYGFRSWDAPAFMQKRGTKDTFSPPELKNYPVQGTGGEFVQAVLGLLFRHFNANGNYGGRAFLVNTVHDCVWVDCHSSVREQVCRDLKRIMESIPEFYNKRHKMNITVPFPVEVEYGLNMHEMHHWKEAA